MTSYNTASGAPIRLGAELGRGGEGTVYAVEHQADKVAKIYHQNHRTRDKERKLTAMVARPLRDSTATRSPFHTLIAWPSELIYDQGHFAGFLMPRIDQSPSIFEVFNPQHRTAQKILFDWRRLHRAARNMAVGLHALHHGGYVVGDINQKNVLVTATALITFIDTDSFQVPAGNGQFFRCPVGVPDYTPPELQGMQARQVDRTPHHDAFGLAVIIFQLLMEGFHPFTGAPQNPGYSVVGQVFTHCITQGIFPYQPNGQFVPPPNAPAFNSLHPHIQSMMLRCFVNGYLQPSARPTALEWADALEAAERDLVACSRSQDHFYSGHLSACPWCARVNLTASLASPPTVRPQTPFQAAPSPMARPQTARLALVALGLVGMLAVLLCGALLFQSALGAGVAAQLATANPETGAQAPTAVPEGPGQAPTAMPEEPDQAPTDPPPTPPAAPSHVPTMPPSPPTAAPSALPTTAPAPADPGEAVRIYWGLASAREYQQAWSYLTPYFRQISHGDSFDAYVRGFQEWQLCWAEALVERVDQQGASAAVTATMRFAHGPACTISEDQRLTYGLVVEPTGGQWRIDTAVAAGASAPPAGSYPDDLLAQSVREYWALVSDGQYETAWARLSPGFRVVSHDDNFANFVQGIRDWGLCRAEPEITAVNPGVVTATLYFQYGDGCTAASAQRFEFYLVPSGNGVWLIDQVLSLP